MKVYLDKRVLGEDNVKRLQKMFPDIQFVTGDSHIEDIDIGIIMPRFFQGKDASSFKRLKWIQFLMAGYDDFDFNDFNRKSIVFTNAQNIFSTSIAEDVLTKILFFNRNVNHYLSSMDEGKWDPIREEHEITHSTIGILGSGSIGREIAKRLKPFDVHIIGYRRKNQSLPNFDEIVTGESGLQDLLKKSDYVIIALPLTTKTHHLINERRIAIMKDDVLLINVARGDIIEQKALYEALVNHQIRGAGLDVTSPEPLPKDHPLWSLDNVFITPHNASSSPYMKKRLTKLVMDNLYRYLNDQPLLYRIER